MVNVGIAVAVIVSVMAGKIGGGGLSSCRLGGEVRGG